MPAKMLLLLAALLLFNPLAVTVAEAAEKPNILFILTDDQGWPTLGCYGSEKVPTPHLDKLAADGMRFTDAYVMPQCTPTRAALLTGQQCARNGMWHVISWYGYPWARVREPLFVENLPRESFTVAKGLQSAGYATACIGKWHLTNNQDGNYMGLKPNAAEHYGFDYACELPGREHFKPGADRAVDYLTDRALEFIEKNRDRPWFCYLSHHTLHGVVVAPEPLVQKYRQQGYPETGMFNATYLAAIEHLDNSIGRLMKRLDELKLRQRTMVVFLTDNGGVDQRYGVKNIPADEAGVPQLQVDKQEFDNAPLRVGKGAMYEGGIRVPCIVRFPGVVEPGSECETPVHVVDWMPTLFEVAAANAREGHVVDGDSLLPLLSREGEFPERSIYLHLPLYDLRWGLTPCAVIRRGDYKLIEFFGDRFDAQQKYRIGHHLELYNLKEDLGETTNLADKMPERAAQLRQDLHRWLKSVPAKIPEKNPHYDPARRFQETREKPAFLLQK